MDISLGMIGLLSLWMGGCRGLVASLLPLGMSGVGRGLFRQTNPWGRILSGPLIHGVVADSTPIGQSFVKRPLINASVACTMVAKVGSILKSPNEIMGEVRIIFYRVCSRIQGLGANAAHVCEIWAIHLTRVAHL